jgi:hypothetical protein
MTDVKIKIAIVIKVSECGRSGPVTVAGKAVFNRHIFKRPITSISPEHVAAPAGDKKVSKAVVVNVAHGYPMAKPSRKLINTGFCSDILKLATSQVLKKAIASIRLGRIRRELATLYGENVFKSIIIEIDQSNTACRTQWWCQLTSIGIHKMDEPTETTLISNILKLQFGGARCQMILLIRLKLKSGD